MTRPIRPRQLEIYQTRSGREPFQEWIQSLRDRQVSAAVRARLERVEAGLFGSFRSVGGGVFELKIDLGPGVRVYFGLEGPAVVLLLCGGDKRSQVRDIRLAQRYWDDYRKREG